METLNSLQNIWFGLIGVLFLGYSLLDGFDLGIGILMPFLAKNSEEKGIVVRSIGPFWDGNEVWLLAAGGALFASFPHVYATVFSGFYLALMLILFSLIFRAVSFEFFYHAEKNPKFWEWGFVIGSFLPSLLYGVALGNVIVGIPLDGNMNFTGNFFTLLRPFPLVMGLLGLNAILIQGSTFIAARISGDIQKRARVIIGYLWMSFILLFALSFVLAIIYLPGVLKNLLAWISALGVMGGWIFLKRSVKKNEYKLSFLMSSLAFTGLWGIVGAIHFPYMVKASNGISLSLTIRNASSTALTLKVMLVIALIGMPLVFLYHFYIFKTFGKK